MSKAKASLSEKVTPSTPKGRKRHSWKVTGGNGKHVSGSTPSQALYNEADCIDNMRITHKALGEFLEEYDRKD